MPKIADREIQLIKGLMVHAGLNDQQILAVFSHLHRDLNSRDIGFIRKGSRPRYQAANAATAEDVKEFLYLYGRVTAAAQQLGLGQESPVDSQVFKAIDLMRTAIHVFNSNVLHTRSETFIVLAIIAWTYLLHAKLRQLSITPVYTEHGEPALTSDGKPKLWDLSKCIDQPQLALSSGIKNNLKYLIAVRNEVEHRSTDDINEAVQSKCQACAINFLKYCADKFGPKFDFSSDIAFAIQLQPLTMKSPNLLKGGKPKSSNIEAVNALLEADMSPQDFNDPEYAFRVYIIPKVTNNSKKADQAVSYAPLGSAVEVAIKQVERPKYLQNEARAILADQGVPLTVYQFQKIWRENKLKEKSKGFAIQLGAQWFWYEEGIAKIKELATS